MKKDNKNSGNEPFYSKYKKPEIEKTSEKVSNESDKKVHRASDKRKPRARIEKSVDKPFDFEKRRSFEKRGDRPGDKPAFKKSYYKPFEKRSEFKPRGEKSFDKPFEKRGDRPDRGDKPAFKKPYDKPYGEKRSFDKPFEKREERGERPAFTKPFDREKRSLDKPYERREERSDRPDRGDDKPAFKKPYDKPYGEKRSFDKPFEKREERGDRPAFNKPFDREKRNFDKPFERREERSGPPTYNKPFDGDKRPRNAEQSDEKRNRAEDGERRRVGDLKEAPRYDLRQAEERYTKKAKNEPVKPYDERIRLNKYIANAGLCSRREADELIETGQITVNSQVVSELGYRVNPGEVVKYGNRVLNPEKMVYILVNKPKDYITTTDDPEGRHTVMELIAGACKERVYPVGRLDRNTTGLLLLTNDGELAEKLMHPSNEVHKIYQVEIDKPIKTEDFEKIKEGMELEDGFIKPDDLALVTPDAMVVGIEIHSGRNRIVRRIFESLGYEVLKLDRTVYAGLTKKEVPRGKWRFLNEKEVVKLKYLT
ncbi:pseudouridine synthase [Runella sp.]|uniref:pseudouridine synthase n=1 Tax=Runella sp. TaxID=1960881 RepID=UPI002612CC50|nr:pseudouridine synthase [Runella sp.]